MSKKAYLVGYKRPPEHTRFKPGQSGNPRGRPRQKKGFAELLHERLFGTVTLRENGERRRMILADVIVRDLIHGAAKGDAKARRDLLELLKRYPRVAKRQRELREITPDMSTREAQKVYEETLEAIKGLDEPDDERDL